MTTIAIGSDHAGYEYKEVLKEFLDSGDYTVRDVGPGSTDSVDYPDFAHPVASAVHNNEVELGVLICGTGNGVAMTANKYKNVRAGLCWSNEIVSLIRQHNNANILCIPARFVSVYQALSMLKIFLETPFEGGRHERRVNKVATCL